MADLDELRSETPDGGLVRANLKRSVIVSPTFGAFYANDTQVQTSPWDVRLMFGLIVEVDPAKKLAVVERVADVRMSLQHAKKVVEVLSQQIQQHEATIGFVAVPTD